MNDAADWRPFRDLLDHNVAAERVAIARSTLVRMSGLTPDAIGERETASITFLGLASRLLSPLLGAASIAGALPLPEPDRLWWRPVPGGPVPVAYRAVDAVPCTTEPATVIAARFTETALARLTGPLLETFRTRFSLSPQVLWGNVASALGGAAGMIADQSPPHASRAAEILEALLLRAPLRATADLVRPDPARDRRFLVRRNCCLYYRIPGGGTCGDCILTPPTDRENHWRAVLHR
ncbi:MULTISPECIES: (2Fe-2S)-binding protein [unclassified Actinoplanes]|uniref:(2Fe-2S)-binding protein n=1 Tax=unclassified Actinoplanes TaxID=2626549 RepID=UPI00030D5D0A|nr:MULTISPECIES: (2Fe-2S)-binding protein [unclassified Actinoplanes]